MICKEIGCEKEAVARGYCHSHYCKARKEKAFIPDSSSKTMQWIIANKDHESHECLIWPFARTKAGYPNMKHNGTYRVASRVMCEIAHGEPEIKSMHAAHSCGNGKGGCINPNHLSWKTAQENEADKTQHGTRYTGEGCSYSKLTWDMVDSIRADSKTMRNKDMATKYGVSKQTISNVVLNKSWVKS